MCGDDKASADRALAALRRYFKESTIREAMAVSIQIRDAANAASRNEVAERLNALMTSACEHFGNRTENVDERAQVRDKLREEVKSLFHALTGYQMTEEQVAGIVYE